MAPARAMAVPDDLFHVANHVDGDWSVRSGIELDARFILLGQHDPRPAAPQINVQQVRGFLMLAEHHGRSEEHTSELQSLMRISYAVFCLKKKITPKQVITSNTGYLRPRTDAPTRSCR